MTEEIKEMNLSEMLFNRDEKLLDYITNLQQKLEQYEKTQTYGDYVETVNKVVELQKENKELKAIAEEHQNCTRKHWQEKCGEHHAKELIYKSRCEKTIEYFKYQLENLDFYEDTKAKMLCAMGITLLQGSDENE